MCFNPSKKEVSHLHDLEVSFVPMECLSADGNIVNPKIRNLDDLRGGSYTYFKDDDILLAKITPCMENGKCALASGLKNGIGMGSSEYHVIRVDKNKILSEFLFGYLNRQLIRDAAQKTMTGSSGHRRVPIDFYKLLEIPVPSLEEQKEIVLKIKKYEERISTLEKSLPDYKQEVERVVNDYLYAQ